MAKHKRTFLLLSLFCLGLVSCGNGEPTSMGSTLYASSENYDYPLVDDPEKGTAIYPDAALRQLRLIKEHNLQHGIEWPTGAYKTTDLFMTIDGGYFTSFSLSIENYIPGEYYLHELEYPTLQIQGEGFFELEGEFYHGVRDLGGQDERYYETSSVEEMEAFHLTHNVRNSHYASFLAIVAQIELKEFSAIPEPRDFQCYTEKEGDLYINVYHTIDMGFGNERRVIARIVYEDYLPAYAIVQTISGIMGDADYQVQSHSVSFGDTPEMRSDLSTFFGERRDA